MNVIQHSRWQLSPGWKEFGGVQDRPIRLALWDISVWVSDVGPLVPPLKALQPPATFGSDPGADINCTGERFISKGIDQSQRRISRRNGSILGRLSWVS